MTDHAHSKTDGCLDGKPVYVFAYGSLMWDGWETQFAGTRHGKGLLPGYSRSFCIVEASGRWGTSSAPGLVLGLVPDATSGVEGILFRFTEDSRRSVLQYLQAREGPHHPVVEMPVRAEEVDPCEAVAALVAISTNDSDAFVGDLPLAERVNWAMHGEGTAGTSAQYVFDTYDRLVALGIDDAEVAAFRAALLRAKGIAG